jgi:uncharacterized protein
MEDSMRNILKQVIYMLMLSAFSLHLFAQTVPIDQAKHDDIRKMLEVTGGTKIAFPIIDQLISTFKKNKPQIPERFWQEFRAGINQNELIELCIPSYDKRFTHDEIKQLLAFYTTPIGKKLLAIQPEIVQECMKAGQIWGQQLAMQILKKAGQNKNDQH